MGIYTASLLGTKHHTIHPPVMPQKNTWEEKKSHEEGTTKASRVIEGESMRTTQKYRRRKWLYMQGRA